MTPRVFEDERGYFLESYRQSVFEQHASLPHFVQDNMSWSRKNVLRGLHYQLNPAAQGKLVHCAVGEILDVAVDIRVDSPSYGRWVSARLDDRAHAMLYVPPGFAHGFVVLSEQALVHYKTTGEYAPHLEAGIRWDDATLAIEWGVDCPIVSEKDQHLPGFDEAPNNFFQVVAPSGC